MNWPWPQHGIGIDFAEGSFRALYLRRQWNRVRVVEGIEIPQYRQLGPAECGKRYRKFLRQHGLKVPWTVVALPRSAVLLRALHLPGAIAEKDVPRAVEYQLDSLHPFEEGSVYWDVSLWKEPEKSWWSQRSANGDRSGTGVSHRMVAIAEKQYVEETAAWFREAGIPVTQFGVTAALLLGTIGPRLEAVAAKRSSFFLVNWGTETVQLVAYAPGRELIWREIPRMTEAGSEREFSAALERELELARSELRVEPAERPPLVICGPSWEPTRSDGEREFQAIPVDELFPALRENWVGFAAALAAADRNVPLAFNLLPAEQRTFQSPLAHLPTYALASLVAILVLALGVRGTLQDWLYNRYLEREIQGLRPQVEQIEAAQEKGQKTLDRWELLGGARDSAALPLEILNELTRLLPADVWLQQLQCEGDRLFLNGQASSASGLLQTLAASPYFESPQFAAAISRTQEGKEVFRITVRLRAQAR